MQQVKSAFSQYYDNKTTTTDNITKRRTFVKSTVSADTNRQLICHTRTRHSYVHDNVDFIPTLSPIRKSLSITLVIADKGYDDEKNHRFVREYLLADSIIPARFESVPV